MKGLSSSGTFAPEERDEAPCMAQRILAELRIRVGLAQRATSVMEVQPTLALRRIVQGLAKGGEVGNAPRKLVRRGGCTRGGKLGFTLGGALEHAGPLLGNWHTKWPQSARPGF